MRDLRLLLVLVAMLAIGLTSCRKNGPTDEKEASKDTQAQIEAKSKIVGKWYIKKVVFTYPTNSNPDVYTGYDNTQFYDFKSDGTVVISYVEKQGAFNYVFSENALTLSLFNPHPNDVYKVKALTSTELVIEKEHTIEPVMTEEITLSK